MNDAYFDSPPKRPAVSQDPPASSAFWAVSCVIGPLLVVATYVFFRESFRASSAQATLLPCECSTKGVDWTAGIQAARTYFAATLYACTLVGLVLLAGSVVLLLGGRRTMVRWIPLVAAGLLFLGICLRPDEVVSGWTSQQLELILVANGFSMTPHLGSFLGLLFATALVLASGIAVAVYEATVAGANVEQLLRVQRDVRNLLAIATVWLIMGMVGLGALNRLAASGSVPEFRAAIDEMGAAATAFSGVFYSALLAAIFGPAELLLRQAGRRLAASNASASTSDDAWLEAQGFDFSVSQSLLRILAILSPLLAGLTHNIADIGAKTP